MTKMETEVLQAASHGAIKPLLPQADAFKSLITKGLIKHMGDNKFKATAEGLKVVMGQADAPAAPAKKAVKAKAAPKAKKTNEELDAEYAKKYSHYVKGSISKPVENGEVTKRTALIKCQTKGCGKTRKVYTSDVFQVKLCLDCRKGKNAEKMAKLKKKAA